MIEMTDWKKLIKWAHSQRRICFKRYKETYDEYHYGGVCAYLDVINYAKKQLKKGD